MTSPGDDPTLGEAIDDATRIATGRGSGIFRGGGGRNPAARFRCGGTSAMLLLTFFLATFVLVKALRRGSAA